MIKGFDDTIDWYNKHAVEFAQKAGSHAYGAFEEFIKLLPENGKVLDAGCGSGRDADLFVQRGFDVGGVDNSRRVATDSGNRNPARVFQGA